MSWRSVKVEADRRALTLSRLLCFQYESEQTASWVVRGELGKWSVADKQIAIVSYATGVPN